MKNILYSLFVLLLCSTIAMAQTPLMSDEDHRIMMNDYATNLNIVLTAELPQGLTIDQFKKKIVNGELTLSSTAQASILTYAEPLKTYGTQFATTKNLIATTDAEKIFLSSFAPSTIIDENGNLVENDLTGGISYLETWQCAVEVCSTVGCSPFGMVDSNSESVNLLSKAVTATLISNASAIGVAVMMGNLDNKISRYVYLKKMGFNLSKSQNFINLVNRFDGFLNSPKDTITSNRLIVKDILNDNEKLELASSLGFQNREEVQNYELGTYNDYAVIAGEFNLINLTLHEKSIIFSSAIHYFDQNSVSYNFAKSKYCVPMYNSCKKDAYAQFIYNSIGSAAVGYAFGGISFICAGCVGWGAYALLQAASLDMYNNKKLMCYYDYSNCLTGNKLIVILKLSLINVTYFNPFYINPKSTFYNIKPRGR